MTRPFLAKPHQLLLTAFLVTCLAGCTKDISLLDNNGNIVGKGTLKISADFPSPAYLMLDGKQYTGHWEAAKIYEEDMAKSRRLISQLAYTTYMIGNDPAQLKHGHASLTSSDGSKIECDFYYRHQLGGGSCSMEGKQLKLTVQ